MVNAYVSLADFVDVLGKLQPSDVGILMDFFESEDKRFVQRTIKTHYDFVSSLERLRSKSNEV